MPLFDRIIDVQVGGKLFPNNLRITFDIVKTNQSVCNSASITIYNLSEDSRNQIRELDDDIVLSAGYREYGGTKLVFKGNILRVNHTYNLPDIMTKIEGGDGIKALRDQRQSVSFEENTSVKDVLNKVSSNLGLTVRELPEDVSGEYTQGFSHAGSVKEGLDKVCQRIGAIWSVQDNELQITKDNSASVHAPVKISRIDGLLEKLERLGDARQFFVDSEAALNSGYRFRTLLNPDIQPGRKLTLGDQGTFRVERVQHQGDNFENDFISIVEVKELNNNG